MAKRGRPSSYNKTFHPKLAEILASTGRIDEAVAKEIGISHATLIKWKKEHPEFLKALKIGKKRTDEKVITALYERAIGYSHPSEKIVSYKGNIKRVPITKHYPPDVAACFIWLKNRLRDEWKDNYQMEHILPEDFKKKFSIFISKIKKRDFERTNLLFSLN